MPLLQLMYFDLIDLNGTLPAEWGSHHSFQQLTDLYIVNEDPQYYDTGLYGGQTGGGSSLHKCARTEYTEACGDTSKEPNRVCHAMPAMSLLRISQFWHVQWGCLAA